MTAFLVDCIYRGYNVDYLTTLFDRYLPDAQRGMSLVRRHAQDWNIDPQRIGICGFSAGGEAAALTALFGDQRHYAAVDDVERHSSRPDFAILVYPAYLINGETHQFRGDVAITPDAPPMFLVHAFDDRVSPQNSLLLANELKKAGGTAELHIFTTGGHGYGLRQTEEAVTRWPVRAAEWMRELGLLSARE